MRHLPRLLLILAIALPAMAQTNIRWDWAATTTQGVGQQVPVLAIPGAVINFYTGCTTLPCVSPATTYQAPTGAGVCPSGQQVVWQLPLAQACTTTADSQGNFGGYFQPGAYQYTVSIGTVTYGPYQFNVGGGGSSGVTQIVAGSNVTISPSGGTGVVTINATGGGGGGGVNPGTVNNIPYYSSTGQVTGDTFFSDTAPTVTNTGSLSYTGPGGALFSNFHGGLFQFSTQNASSTTNVQDSQILLNTITSLVQAGASNPGQILLSTDDSSGMTGAGNINLSAEETNSASSNAANVNISASVSGVTSQSGNVNISATGDDAGGLSGNINLTANQASPGIAGGNINIFTAGTTSGANTNFINLSAQGGGAPITLTASNVTLDSTGDLFASGTLGATGTITSNTSVVVNNTSGTGGSMAAGFGSAPGASASTSTLWADSVKSRWLMNNANAGAQVLPGVTTAGTPGHCWQVAADGYGLVDAGASCNGGMTGTPTFTLDSGAGTGATASFSSNSNDGSGWITVNTGTSPPTGTSVGIITINYGGTYATIPKCGKDAANAAASALSGNGQVFISSGTNSTTVHFVISTGTTGLAASTTYIWKWGCSL